MAKLTLSDILSGYQTSTQYNANNALIEAALENTLSRDGTTPNTMTAELDMNSNDLNNVGDMSIVGNMTGVTSINTLALAINDVTVVPGSTLTIPSTIAGNKIFSGDVTIQGLFTSVGIDDSADQTVLTLSSAELATFNGDVFISNATPQLRFIDTDVTSVMQIFQSSENFGISADPTDVGALTTITLSTDGINAVVINSSQVASFINPPVVGTLGIPVVIIKTADEEITNSDTLQDDDDLFFNLEANATYAVEFYVGVVVDEAADDFKFDWIHPTLCEFQMDGVNWQGATTRTNITTTETNSSDIIAIEAAVVRGSYWGKGTIRNGANAGNFQFQWAQNAIDAVNGHIVKKGSWIKYTKL